MDGMEGAVYTAWEAGPVMDSMKIRSSPEEDFMQDPLTLITYFEELTCTIISATSITGDYLISDPLSGASDYGTFTLALISTVPLI